MVLTEKEKARIANDKYRQERKVVTSKIDLFIYLGLGIRPCTSQTLNFTSPYFSGAEPLTTIGKSGFAIGELRF